MGGLETIERHLPDLPERPATAKLLRAKDMALQGVKRASTLTSRLLAFSRQQTLSPKKIDANSLVAGICDLLRRALGEFVSLETVLAGGLWPTFVDSNQLESAILNLALNARDAMPSGGKLTIETANASLDQNYVSSLLEPVAPGQYVLVAVSDTGTGMDRATLDRAFDPFFTTKEAGKGTGLGLSQVYGFARQSSGHVKIYSEVGEGTTVKIYLPRHFGEDHEVKTDGVKYDGKASGCETVLVVEDDEALRAFTSEALREMGYRVVDAPSGKAALEIVGGEEIDLLLTDVVMPGGVNGRQLADAALKLRPKLKVLFMTGYTRNAIVHHGRLDPGLHMIGKPFTYPELARAVRARLDFQS
jgi:CheY-like chemotaxis protein